MHFNRKFGALMKICSKMPAWLAAAAVACSIGTAAAGETAQPGDNATGQVFTLGEVVVEGERDTISKVTTVDTIKKETIDLNTATNVADALKAVPGVTMAIGSRNEKSLTIRGFTQRYIPVFYDGIPIYIPYDGYVDHGQTAHRACFADNRQQGHKLSLYGPNTMGGVINIVSRKPEKKFEADFDAGWSEGSRWDIQCQPRLPRRKILFHGQLRLCRSGCLCAVGAPPQRI